MDTSAQTWSEKGKLKKGGFNEESNVSELSSVIEGPGLEQNGTMYHLEDAMGKAHHSYCQNSYAEKVLIGKVQTAHYEELETGKRQLWTICELDLSLLQLGLYWNDWLNWIVTVKCVAQGCHWL